MAQRKTNPYNVANPVNEDIYDEVELPEYQTEKKELKAQSYRRSDVNTLQENSSVEPIKPQKKFPKMRKILILAIILLLFISILVIIALASAAISLVRNTQVRCPNLESLGNGSIAITPGDYVQLGLGAVANYSCNPGFRLIGAMIRGCRLSSGGQEFTGSWNTSEPSCQAIVLCPTLESPTNGQLRSTSRDSSVNLVVGSTADFSCDLGYVMAGQESLVCMAIANEAEWNGNRPTCQRGTVLDCHQTNCRSTELSCMGDGHCRIGCNDTKMYACHNSSIICSQTESGCTVACDETYSCLQSAIRCPTVGDCNVNCLGARACTRANAICQNGNCVINCNDEYSCQYLVAALSSAEKSYVGCRGNRACQYMNLNCPVGRDCALSCDNDYSCQYASSSLPEGSIECKGVYSCDNMMFANSEQIICSGSLSCRYSNMNGQNYMCAGSLSCQYGTLMCNNTDSCNIDCFGSSSCERTNFDCSRSNSCQISCTAETGSSACRYATFNCPSLGTCDINCTGLFACRNANFQCAGTGSCNITCIESNACLSATFTCPVDDAFEILCNGSSACTSASIDCSNSNSCKIACFGSSSCQSMQMTCPINNTCALTCSGSSSCTSSRLVCPTNKPCDIECDGPSSCNNLQLTCSDQELCGLTCSGTSSCSGYSYSCPTNGICSYQCSGLSSCSSSSFTCTDSRSCALACTGERACQSTTLYCPANNDCTITCNGLNGCQNAHVICPVGDYECNIICADPVSCSSLSITNTHNTNLQCCGNLSCQGANVIPSSYQCNYREEL